MLYNPIEAIQRENRTQFIIIMATSPSDAELLKILEQAFEEAWEIVNSEDGWKEEHKEKGKYF